MSARILLDTSAVLFLVRGNGPAADIRRKYGQIGDGRIIPFISVVTKGEALVMAERNSWGEAKRRLLDRLLNQCIAIDITKDVIDAYVEASIVSDSASGGARKPGKNDLWIAASAKASGSVLVTTDKDFSHFGDGFVDVDLFEVKGTNVG